LSESQTEHYEEDAPPPLVEPPSLSQNPGPPPTLQESSATAPSAEKHALGADSVVSASLLSTAIPQGKKLPPEDSGLVRSRHQPQSGGYASRDTSGGRGKPHLCGFWSRRLVLLAVVAVAGVAFFLGYGSRLLVTSPPETPAESNVTCGTGTMLNENTCVCIREVRSVLREEPVPELPKHIPVPKTAKIAPAISRYADIEWVVDSAIAAKVQLRKVTCGAFQGNGLYRSCELTLKFPTGWHAAKDGILRGRVLDGEGVRTDNWAVGGPTVDAGLIIRDTQLLMGNDTKKVVFCSE